MAAFERPRGTRDFGPDEMERRRALESKLRAVIEGYGYREVQTPTFEHLELFTAKSGAGVVEQLYAFEDKSDRPLALRPELTAPVIRFFVNELSSLPKPLRLYYFGNCFRYERPQAGRYREFWQMGLELIGGAGPLGDAEVVAVAVACVRAAGVERFSVRVGHIGLLRLLVGLLPADEAARARTWPLIDKGDRGLTDHLSSCGASEALAHAIETVAGLAHEFDLAGDEGALRATLTSALEPARTAVRGAGLTQERLAAAEAHIEHVTETLLALGALGVPRALADLGVARGLDYYTGLVFEIEAPDLGAEKQICGGGAYTLAELFGGQPTPTAGFGLGFDRVLLASSAKAPARRASVHIAPIGEETRTAAARLATDLRGHGIACTLDVIGRSPSKNLDYANAVGVAKVVLLGPKELERGAATVKDMKSGAQSEVPLKDLARHLR